MNQQQTEAIIKSTGYAYGVMEKPLDEIMIFFASDLDLNIVRDRLIEAGIAKNNISAAILVKFKENGE